eukprot:2758768-Rhodomonas_salina.1
MVQQNNCSTVVLWQFFCAKRTAGSSCLLCPFLFWENFRGFRGVDRDSRRRNLKSREGPPAGRRSEEISDTAVGCLLYTSDAADDM